MSNLDDGIELPFQEHERSLSEKELEERNARSARKLKDAGAHVVLDTLAGLPAAVAHFNDQLARGIGP